MFSRERSNKLRNGILGLCIGFTFGLFCTNAMAQPDWRTTQTQCVVGLDYDDGNGRSKDYFTTGTVHQDLVPSDAATFSDAVVNHIKQAGGTVFDIFQPAACGKVIDIEPLIQIGPNTQQLPALTGNPHFDQ